MESTRLGISRPLPDAPAAFDREGALRRVGGDAAFLGELIGELLGQWPDQLAELRGAVAAGNADAVQRVAHRMKGSLASLGAAEGCEAAGAVESAASRSELSEAIGAVTRLERAVGRFAEAVDQFTAGG